MKNAISLLLLLTSIAASADEDKTRYCIFRSQLYAQAATLRDAGMSPQDAWNSSLKSDSNWGAVQTEERKYIVNQVYFDSNFEHASGEKLRQQIFELCKNGPKAWKPLK